MAVADAKYKFSYIDVGAYGSEGDAGVFSSSKLGKAMANESLPFPPDAKIHDKRLPFFFVGDDAFPLGKRLIKPYVPKRNQMLEPDKTIFNYRCPASDKSHTALFSFKILINFFFSSTLNFFILNSIN